MSRNQRLTFLGIAALIAVAAIVVFATSGGSGEREDTGTTIAEGTATPTATPSAAGEEEAATSTPTPEPKPPLLQAGKVVRLRFEEGETVRFRARSEVAEEIHVHGYDRYVDLPAGKIVTESFEATITGIFEIELHGSAEQIAELRVDPR